MLTVKAGERDFPGKSDYEMTRVALMTVDYCRVNMFDELLMR